MMKENERAARLATLESFFRLAAENPEVDFSKENDENDVAVAFDPIRNIEPNADVELEGKPGLFLASW